MQINKWARYLSKRRGPQILLRWSKWKRRSMMIHRTKHLEKESLERLREPRRTKMDKVKTLMTIRWSIIKTQTIMQAKILKEMRNK